MIGAILVALAMVVVGPALLFVGGAALSAIFGAVSVVDAEGRYGDTEYVSERVW